MDHSKDWLTAFDALRSVYSDGAYSNMALNEAIPRRKGCRDSFVRNFVKGTIRHTYTLDHIIGMLASGGLKGIRIRPLIILRMGLYAIRDLDSVPDHAAVNEAVSLARRTAKGTDRFINAVLRSYIRRREEFGTAGSENGEVAVISSGGGTLPDPPFITSISDPVKRLSVKYSMPCDLTSLIMEQYGSEAETVLRGLNEPPKVVIRVNTLKTTREELIGSLGRIGIKAGPSEESALAVVCEGGSIIDSEPYREGLFTVQSLSSIMAVEALAPQPGCEVLDMCAAPGGKSTMMAELMYNRGKITACDIHEHRLRLIEASAQRTGADIIETRLADGTTYDSALAERYDFVLADVPCSGLGVMSTKPDIRLHTNAGELAELEDIQLGILRNAYRYTKPGGRICYSTCTLNKAENEDVIARFLEGHGESAADERTDAEVDTSCGSRHGFAHIVEMNTILPYNNLIGFYYCIIEKTVSIS